MINTKTGIGYPYDYPYDYGLSVVSRNIVCESTRSCDFRIVIYGEAVNPSVVIGGHAYAVNGTIGKGETLLIDSVTKTITLTTANGNKINWFDKRSRKEYIFEPLPVGKNLVNWSGTFGFDLTVIEKRSEPRWT
jgi:phage-related protein